MNQLNNMNYQELLEVIKSQSEDVSDFAYGSLGEHLKVDGHIPDYNVKVSKELGVIKRVADHGGEDQGSDWYRVYHFVDHDVYIKASGYYSSYNGTDFNGWDSVEEVKPVVKQVTFYE